MNKKPETLSDIAFAEKSHTTLLRWFTVSSVISIIAILILVSIGTYSIISYNIFKEAEFDSKRTGEILHNRYIDLLISMDAEGKMNLSEVKAQEVSFDQNIREILKLFDILKIKIFTKDRKIIYSTDRKIIGEVDTKNELLEFSLKGKIASKVKKRGGVLDINDEQRFDIDMVETYFPVEDYNKEVVGSFEIYLDITKYREQIRNITVLSAAITFVILLIAFGILFLIMRRAAKVIYAKTEEIKVLSGILPICSFCKKIKDDAGKWEQMETYITERSESAFSHSLCPDCLKEHYPEIAKKM